jgi:hypothetical protein
VDGDIRIDFCDGAARISAREMFIVPTNLQTRRSGTSSSPRRLAGSSAHHADRGRRLRPGTRSRENLRWVPGCELLEELGAGLSPRSSPCGSLTIFRRERQTRDPRRGPNTLAPLLSIGRIPS